MESILPVFFQLSESVKRALGESEPIVALESTVISHGLPYPQNLELAEDMEAEVRRLGGVPATVAVLDGKVRVGLESGDLKRLAISDGLFKISRRDFAPAIANLWGGGTTVAGTMIAAYKVGIRVFATGGIGGVHRQSAFDISADLQELARTPMIVVCAGAKAILDLPATLEYLETFAVPVVGYQTDEFPAFYSRSSGLPVSVRAETPAEVVDLARAHWEMEMPSAILVANPVPEEFAMEPEEAANAIDRALHEAAVQHVRGQAVTPFLLERVAQLTGGASLQSNLALLHNNARLAAEIARVIVRSGV